MLFLIQIQTNGLVRIKVLHQRLRFVRMLKSLNKGIDPQLQRAVKEAISRLPKTKRKITPPPFLTPALKK